MNNLIDVNTTVTQGLYRSMMYFQTFMRKRTTLPFAAFAGLIAAFNIVGRLLGMYEPGALLFYCSIGYFAFGLFTVIMIEQQCAKIAKTDKATLGKTHRMVVNDKGVSSTVGSSHSEFAWDKLYEVHETNKMFLFYINANQAIVLPRADITEEQHKELQKLVMQKMDKMYVIH